MRWVEGNNISYYVNDYDKVIITIFHNLGTYSFFSYQFGEQTYVYLDSAKKAVEEMNMFSVIEMKDDGRIDLKPTSIYGVPFFKQFLNWFKE